MPTDLIFPSLRARAPQAALFLRKRILRQRMYGLMAGAAVRAAYRATAGVIVYSSKTGIHLALSVLTLAAAGNSGAIESIQLDAVSKIPAQVRLVVPCGRWAADGKSGVRRLVLADVYGGAGTEVYVQWITAGAGSAPTVIRTQAFPELNNDHAQYSFSSGRCEKVGATWTARLKGTFEHDERPRTRNISIKLLIEGRYVVTGTAGKK